MKRNAVWLKRVFDVTAAAAALALLTPLLALIAAAIRITMGRPILFRQRRPGRHGQPFTILKFRTMAVPCDGNGRPGPDAQRITRLGAWLRASSLDELPELWNVLRGDMSLVGPRPLLMAYLDRYTPRQARRMEVRPGLTGWAQIHGRNAITWEARFEYDVWYVEHASFWLDLYILVVTVFKTLRREGIAAAGHATMPEFQGSTHSSRKAA